MIEGQWRLVGPQPVFRPLAGTEKGIEECYFSTTKTGFVLYSTGSLPVPSLTTGTSTSRTVGTGVILSLGGGRESKR